MNRRDMMEEEIDLKELFLILKNNKKWIFFFTFLALLIAGLFVYFSTPLYKTDASVEVSPTPKQINTQDLITQALGMTESSSIDTESEIIKSRSMIEATLNKVNFTKRYFVVKYLKKRELYNDSPIKVDIEKGKDILFEIEPIDESSFILKAKSDDPDNEFEYEKKHKYDEKIISPYFVLTIHKIGEIDLDAKYEFIWRDKVETALELQENLNVSPVSQNANILKITFSDNIPQRVANFVNELINIYINQSIKIKTQQADQTLKFIDEQLKIISKKLAESEVALEQFKKKHNLINVQFESQTIITKLNDVETQLNELILKENTINYIEKKIKNANSVNLISSGLVDDPVLSDLLTQLQQLILQKNTLLIEYTPKHPDVIKVESQIRSLIKMIKNRIYSLKQTILNQKRTLMKIKNQYLNMLKALPQNERKLIDLTRTYQVNEKIYSYLLEKRAATAIAKASILSDNRIIDTAIVPKKPYKPKKALILAIGAILGVVLGIIFVFIKEMLNTKIKTKDDVKKLTDVPIVGSVPHYKEKYTTLKVFKSPKSSFAEAFRVIRANIKFLSNKQPLVITVTSTVGGEGKTTTSSNLAGIYAIANKKTIVVNLDMRKPTLHTIFDVPNDIGISNVLAGDAKINQAIKKTTYSNLDVITSGPVPPNPGELIQSKKLDEVIEYLKQNYDVIVFDTPPVGLVIDAINVLVHSDVNLYIVRLNYSKKEYLEVVNDLKYNKNIKGLGIVINDVTNKEAGYGYGYGYYSEE